MELQEYGDLINLESPISKTSKRIAFFLLGLYALCLLLVFISFIFIRETTIRDVLIKVGVYYKLKKAMLADTTNGAGKNGKNNGDDESPGSVGGIGEQLTPELRNIKEIEIENGIELESEIKKTAFKLSAIISVDIPLFKLYSQSD